MCASVRILNVKHELYKVLRGYSFFFFIASNLASPPSIGILCHAFKILNVNDNGGYGDFGDISFGRFWIHVWDPVTHLFLLIDEIDCAFVTRTCVYCILSSVLFWILPRHILRSRRYITFENGCFAWFVILRPLSQPSIECLSHPYTCMYFISRKYVEYQPFRSRRAYINNNFYVLFLN